MTAGIDRKECFYMKNTKSLLGLTALLLVIGFMALVLTGCPDANGGDDTGITVSVSPSTASVAKGGTQQFTATVTGTNSPAQTVTWSVSGGGTGTAISSAAGVLSVAASESAARWSLPLPPPLLCA
jgi:hypothetical protein